jgi:hypothetical protein
MRLNMENLMVPMRSAGAHRRVAGVELLRWLKEINGGRDTKDETEEEKGLGDVHGHLETVEVLGRVGEGRTATDSGDSVAISPAMFN